MIVREQTTSAPRGGNYRDLHGFRKCLELSRRPGALDAATREDDGTLGRTDGIQNPIDHLRRGPRRFWKSERLDSATRRSDHRLKREIHDARSRATGAGVENADAVEETGRGGPSANSIVTIGHPRPRKLRARIHIAQAGGRYFMNDVAGAAAAIPEHDLDITGV